MATHAFREATTTSYNAGWNIFDESSGDKALDVGDSLITLRKKSQQLIRDNPIVAGFQQTYINMISGTGPTIYCESKNAIQEKQANKVLEEWLDNSAMCGNKSYSQILEEKIAASFADGDVLVSYPLDKQRDGVQTVVELIEAYRVMTPSDMYKDQNIRHGVKYDDSGRILGYYVKKYDKLGLYISDNSTNFDFYPMYSKGRLVTYLFKAPLNNRPSSSRQYPAITPCISELKDLGDYRQALVIGMRVAACFATFIVSKNPAASAKLLTTDSDGNTQSDSGSGRRFSKLQPGMIGYLQQGEEVQFASPNRPGDNVDSFILRSCKLLSMPLRIPYVIAFLDTSEVNYSSWRGANLDMKRMIGRWQRDLGRDVRHDIGTVFEEASLRGMIRGNSEDIVIKIRWPSLGVLDMEKEARGNKIALESQVTSKTQITDEQSEDLDQIDEELTKEAIITVEREALVLKRKMELEKQYGIKFPELGTDGKPDKFDPSGEENTENRKEDGNW